MASSSLQVDWAALAKQAGNRSANAPDVDHGSKQQLGPPPKPAACKMPQTADALASKLVEASLKKGIVDLAKLRKAARDAVEKGDAARSAISLAVYSKGYSLSGTWDGESRSRHEKTFVKCGFCELPTEEQCDTCTPWRENHSFCQECLNAAQYVSVANGGKKSMAKHIFENPSNRDKLLDRVKYARTHKLRKQNALPKSKQCTCGSLKRWLDSVHVAA